MLARLFAAALFLWPASASAQPRTVTPFEVLNEICLSFLMWGTRPIGNAVGHARIKGFRLDAQEPDDFTLSLNGATLNIYQEGSGAELFGGCDYRVPNYPIDRMVSELAPAMQQYGFQRTSSRGDHQMWIRDGHIDITFSSFDFMEGDTTMSVTWSATPE
jgi:hypothetical protein